MKESGISWRKRKLRNINKEKTAAAKTSMAWRGGAGMYQP